MAGAARTCWTILGMEQTADERGIKRAYARLLKSTRPEDDAAAFQELRDAYDLALRLAARARGAAEQAKPAPAGADAESSGPARDETTRADAPSHGDVAPERSASVAPAEAAPLHAAERTTVAHPPVLLDAQGAPAPAPAAPPYSPPILLNKATPPTGGANPPERHVDRDLAEHALWLWQGFLERASTPVGTERALAQLSKTDVLLNFSLREAFERHALLHCADEACADSLRGALVAHFGWEETLPHLNAADTRAAHTTLGRHWAAVAHAHFRQLAVTDRLYQVLLADRHPATSGDLRDAAFTRRLKEVIPALREQHPYLVKYKLNPDVLNWWEKQARQKRLSNKAMATAAICGVVLDFVAHRLHDRLGWFPGVEFKRPVFFACEALSFLLFAWFTFFPPLRAMAAAARLKDAATGKLHRHQKRWELGWLPPFFVLAMLLLLPEPAPFLRYGVTAGMALCAAAALMVGSLQYQSAAMLQLVVPTAAAATAMYFGGFDQFGAMTCALTGLCLSIMALRGGGHAWTAANFSPRALTRGRAAWLLGCVPLALGLTAGRLPAPEWMVWAWCLAGLTMSRLRMSKGSGGLLIAGLFLLKFIVMSGIEVVEPLNDPRFMFLLPAFALVAVSILFNMYQSAFEQLHFS